MGIILFSNLPRTVTTTLADVYINIYLYSENNSSTKINIRYVLRLFSVNGTVVAFQRERDGKSEHEWDVGWEQGGWKLPRSSKRVARCYTTGAI